LVSALSDSEKGQQDKSMCDIWEGRQASECLIPAVSGHTEKNLEDTYIIFHDIPWRTGSIKSFNILPV